MKNTKIILIVFIALILVGLIGYLFRSKNQNNGNVNEPVATSTTAVTYTNNDFGFNFSLSNSWKGYSVLNNTWEGNPLTTTTTKQTGTKLIIRNPKWTSSLPYEDIPIMVFTVAQWNSYIDGNFSVSAAPVSATELGRNNLYVFALPPRWDFDFSEGYVEAQNIIKSNPLKAFNKENNASGKLNIDVVCQNSLSYMSFPDGASASKFVSECKEGKHPEVIEKYKADMNLGDGANI